MEEDFDEKENDENLTPSTVNNENQRPMTTEEISSLSPKVMEAILTVQGEIDSITIPFHDILAAIKRDSLVKISKRELISVLKSLQDDNKVMLKEDEELLYIV